MSQPAHKLRDGCLAVVIWRNTSTGGQTYYTFNPTRSFKAGDDTWKETDSMGADDLLPMAELLREAYAWVKYQKRADAKAARNATTSRRNNEPGRGRGGSAHNRKESNMTHFVIYQLAPDHATFGADDGKSIVTSEDLEREFSGPMSEDDARTLASALNACQAVAVRWERGDRAEAARLCAAVVEDVSRKPA